MRNRFASNRTVMGLGLLALAAALVAPRVLAQGTIRPLLLKGLARAILVDEQAGGTGRIVVAYQDNTLTVLDMRSRAELRQLLVGPPGYISTALAMDRRDGRVIVPVCNTFVTAHSAYGHVIIFDAATAHLLHTVPLSFCPVAVAVDDRPSQNKSLGDTFIAGVVPVCAPPEYVLHRQPGSLTGVTQVPLQHGASGMPLPVACGSDIGMVLPSGFPSGVAPITGDGLTQRMLPTGEGIGVVIALNAHSGTIVRMIQTEPVADLALQNGHLFATAFDPSGTGTLLMLDPQRLAVLHKVQVGHRPSVLAVGGKTARVIVLNEDDGTASVLDARSGSVVRTTRVGSDPLAVAIDGARGRAFVVSAGSHLPNSPSGPGILAVLDARSGALLHTTAVGVSPSDVAIDPPTGLAAVIDDDVAGSKRLMMIDGHASRVRTISLCGYPSALAVAGGSGALYIASQAFTYLSDPCGPPLPLLDGLVGLQRYTDDQVPSSGRLSIISTSGHQL